MSGHLSEQTAEEWVEERVERYAAGLCPSGWHDSGHSFHSTCGSCRGTFMRHSSIEAERRRLLNFAESAEAFAVATGWSK